MSALFAYIRNIACYLLFSALAGMLAPAGKYKKYVSLITGFVLLALMLAPLRGWLPSGEIPMTEWFAGVTLANPDQGDASAYASYRDTYLREAFEEQLYAQLEALLAREGYALQTASFTYADDLSRLNGLKASVTVTQTGKQPKTPFIRIEPVRVATGGETEPEDPSVSRVKKLIADFYNLPAEHIYVSCQ